MIEHIKAWLQPSVVLVVAAQAFASHGWLKDIDTRSLATEKDVGKLELKVGVLDTATNVATARSAVVETQLGYVVESLKRIENRMEANADRKR